MYRNRKIISGLVVIAASLCIFWGGTFTKAEEEGAGNAIETMPQEEQQPFVPDMNEEAQPKARTITVTGIINEDYQLVTAQGVVYEIAETEAGDVMVQYIGEEVMAKGTELRVDDQRVLSVVSFEFVEK